MEKQKLIRRLNRFIRAAQAASEPELKETFCKLAKNVLIKYRKNYV